MNSIETKIYGPVVFGNPTTPLRSSKKAIDNVFDPEAVFRAGILNHHIANTAYPIAHKKTIWSYRKPPRAYADIMKDTFSRLDRMCLYAHIPFCEKRCAFCEYTVLNSHDEDMEETYHRSLLAELDLYAELIGTRNKTLAGFDIGGGTPSMIAPFRIGELVDRVHGHFRIAPEFGISIETTPKIAAEHPEKIRAYRSFGIERISMGLQMINPRLLREYGREINKVGFNHRAVENIRNAGFRRFNIDLMYGFAKQSVSDFKKTLDYTIRLSPDYITLYRMRYKGTRIAGEASNIDLIRVIEMYETARKTLLEAGYSANPGKNGFSRIPDDPGTSEYLTERVIRSTPYLGIGLGAQTFTNRILAYNHGAASKKMDRYVRTLEKGNVPVQDLYVLPPRDSMAKMVSVSFYFGQIHLDWFKRIFGKDLETVFPLETEFVIRRGLMEYHDRTLRLTRKGAGAINGVIPLFYSDKVKAHLIQLGG